MPVNLDAVLRNDRELSVDIFGTPVQIRYRPLALGREEQRQVRDRFRDLERKRRTLARKTKAEDDAEKNGELDLEADPVIFSAEAEQFSDEFDATKDEQLFRYLSEWDLVRGPKDAPIPLTLDEVSALHPVIKEKFWEAIQQDLLPNSPSETKPSENSDGGSSTETKAKVRSMGGTPS
jgi:hypothetical protein